MVLPQFEQKFPQKSVWIHHHASDSTEITYSSMEEAEWKLMHVVSGCSYEDFEKIILSDPSSMDYPFDSLFSDDKTYCDVFPHPAFVFDEKGGFSGYEEDGQNLYTEICDNNEMYDALAKDNFRTLGYFDPNESAVYIRTYVYKNKDEFNRSTQMTNHYRKFVWNGKKFVCEK